MPHAVATSVVALLLLAPAAGAEIVTWEMVATGAQVANAGTPDGSTDSTAIGPVTITYDSFNRALTWDVEWTGLEGLLTGLHVQGPADPGTSTDVRLWDLFPDEPSVIGSGVGRTSGGWIGSSDLERMVDETSTPPVDPGVGLSYMVQDRTYLNVDTQLWPGGEIRADFVRVSGSLPSTRSQARCSTTNDKNLAKLVTKRAKQLRGCVSKASKGKLVGTLESCASDVPSSVAKATGKVARDFEKRCWDLDSDNVPNFPFFAASEPEMVGEAGVEAPLRVLRALWGDDLDAAVGTGDVGRCQVAVLGAAQRCGATRLKEFNACKKNGLRGGKTAKLYPGADDPFDDASDVEACLPFADARDKVAKACVEKVRKAIVKRCESVDLTSAFAAAAPADGDALAAAVDSATFCQGCRMLNSADHLAFDCETLDNGAADGSCPPE